MIDTSDVVLPPSMAEAVELIWLEADLLDGHDYRAWLAMWTDDGRYVIPIERSTEDFEETLNIAYDDGAMRSARVKRLLSGFSMSSAPAARTVRTVSRFRVINESDGAMRLRAAMQLVEFKYQRTRVLAADVDYLVVRRPEGLRIHCKIVRLINSDDALHGIGYLL